MKLSELLVKYLSEYNYKYEIHNEKEFFSLGLVASETGSAKCTFLEQEKFISDIKEDTVMVITTEEYAQQLLDRGIGVCVTPNPRILYFRLHNAISSVEPYARPKYDTVIGDNCMIHDTAVIATKNVTIGNNVVIEEHVVIRENTVIGDNSIIRAGVIIGGPDFEFKREGDSIFGVEHCGGVIIGKEVEILSNTGVNKALYPWDDTVIGDYTKIDMLCNISHGAKIGKNNMIVALSGVGGRTVIGDNCWIGYGTIIRNGIEIGDNARVNMGAVVSKSVDEHAAVTGNFAIDHDKFMADLKSKAK